MDNLLYTNFTGDYTGKKVTYVLSRLPHFFYHESVIAALCKRGVHVNLLFVKGHQISKDESHEELKQGVLERLETLAEFHKLHKNLTVYELRKDKRNISEFCINLRFIRSYASYLQRSSKDNYYLKRWFNWMPEISQYLCSIPLITRLLKFPFVINLLEKVDLLLPANRNIVNYLNKHKPDWVIVSPANTRTISDAEWIKAAKKTGIRNGIVVLSWDNLTTKGLIHILPDYVFAWNQIQANDAINIHKMPKDRVRIVGSPFFDKWKNTKNLIRPRDEFMRSQKLNPDFPYIVYLGSSGNIADDETWLIRKIAEALKASSIPELQNLQILVRPHSSNQENLKKLEGLPIVFTDSEYIGVPFSEARQVNMFNTLYHCAVTISINTSAIIDAILIGKSCISIKTDKYQDTHLGSAHFRNLLDYNAVLLVENIDECLSAIHDYLTGKDKIAEQRNKFVLEFINSPETEKTAGETIADFLFPNV